MMIVRILTIGMLGLVIFVVGCQRETTETTTNVKKTGQTGQGAHVSADEIKAARAQLNEEDRKLANAQEYCVIMTEHRLGEMGVPVKLTVKDQPVFLCCKGCRTKALANPEKTLATVEELKAKVKADSGKK